MKNILLSFFVSLSLFTSVRAQETEAAYSSHQQMNETAPSSPNKAMHYQYDHPLRRGTVGLIIGGTLIAGGITLLILGGNEQPNPNSRVMTMNGLSAGLCGLSIFVRSGVRYLLDKPGSGYYSKISAYSDVNHVGLAYNFR